MLILFLLGKKSRTGFHSASPNRSAEKKPSGFVSGQQMSEKKPRHAGFFAKKPQWRKR